MIFHFTRFLNNSILDWNSKKKKKKKKKKKNRMLKVTFPKDDKNYENIIIKKKSD
jgi:hypothetical protein